MDFLRDPVWQFIGAVFGVIAIGVAIVIPLIQRQRRSLSYRVVSLSELVQLDPVIAEDVRITLAGEPIERAHIVLVEVENDGNSPIIPSDFIKPLAISFGETGSIWGIQVELRGQLISELDHSVENNRVIVSPLLLNPGDKVAISGVIVDLIGSVTLSSRVVGVRQLRDKTKVSKSNRGLFEVLMALAVSGGMTIGLFLARASSERVVTAFVFSFIGILFYQVYLRLIGRWLSK